MSRVRCRGRMRHDPVEDLVVRGKGLADTGRIGRLPENLVVRLGCQIQELGEGSSGHLRLP